MHFHWDTGGNSLHHTLPDPGTPHHHLLPSPLGRYPGNSLRAENPGSPRAQKQQVIIVGFGTGTTTTTGVWHPDASSFSKFNCFSRYEELIFGSPMDVSTQIWWQPNPETCLFWVACQYTIPIPFCPLDSCLSRLQRLVGVQPTAIEGTAKTAAKLIKATVHVDTQASATSQVFRRNHGGQWYSSTWWN